MSPAATNIDILSLQLQSNVQELAAQASKTNGIFTNNQLTIFKDKLIQLLGESNCIEISNQKRSSGKSSGFFTLQLNREGVFLFMSTSTKRIQYVFSFESNQLEVNKRAVSLDFLPDFIKRIDFISQKVTSEECDVFET